ncbi:MAG: hypothetical protein ACR2J6_08575 [Thermoleophilaceae bacterium]
MSGDAALVAALAATAMPFAHTAEEQTESWLRTLRLHGIVGSALQDLGVKEEPLLAGSEPRSQSVGTTAPEGDVVEHVVRGATEFAIAHDEECVGTADLLFAVFDVYGRTMDRALYLHGLARAQVFDCLAGAGCPLPG